MSLFESDLAMLVAGAKVSLGTIAVMIPVLRVYSPAVSHTGEQPAPVRWIVDRLRSIRSTVESRSSRPETGDHT